jgi:hypothetical protein
LPRANLADESSTSASSPETIRKERQLRAEQGANRRDRALARELGALRDEVEELKRGPQDLDDKGKDSELETDHDPEAEATLLAEAYESQLGREGIDTEWRSAMQDRFDDFFETATGARLGDAECRSTICRIDVTVDSPTDRATLIGRVSSLLEPGAEGFAHIENEDDTSIQVYLSRKDTRLPVRGVGPTQGARGASL